MYTFKIALALIYYFVNPAILLLALALSHSYNA